ncbi:hypothetical protein AmDm5_3018 [Acetobacter malorum]|nr:hypothetical protein AmDm5_3018 [Acetobacter malorum]
MLRLPPASPFCETSFGRKASALRAAFLLQSGRRFILTACHSLFRT